MMYENHLYNLLEQLTTEQKSLWRIKRDYPTDAEGCKECLKFWEKMEKDKEGHIKELLRMVKMHLKD